MLLVDDEELLNKLSSTEVFQCEWLNKDLYGMLRVDWKLNLFLVYLVVKRLEG